MRYSYNDTPWSRRLSSMVDVGEQRIRLTVRGCEKQKEINAGTRPAAGVNKAKPGTAGLRMTYR
jgi:hypothetical protein